MNIMSMLALTILALVEVISPLPLDDTLLAAALPGKLALFLSMELYWKQAVLWTILVEFNLHTHQKKKEKQNKKEIHSTLPIIYILKKEVIIILTAFLVSSLLAKLP